MMSGEQPHIEDVDYANSFGAYTVYAPGPGILEL